MKTKNIHQIVTFKAEPKDVYHSLMDSKIHSEIAGSKAVIGTKVGSAFSVWDGGINGYNLALDPGKKIVQAWRTEEWPKDHYSIAIFDLEKTDDGTRLIFDHYAVPADDYKNIREGWKTFYWTQMKTLFRKK
jgi:activator of HSP90 ATPase